MIMQEHTVPEGYKMTEFGVIPLDWEYVNFGELFEQSITRKQLKQNDVITFIGMQDVSESAQLTNPQNRIFGEVKAGFTYFERNDVLVAKITPCFENGKGCYTDEMSSDVGFGSTEFHVLRAKGNSDSKFIYFWTTRNSLRKDLEGEMVGSAGHRRVPFSAIQNYLIPCPSSRAEQTAIANSLTDIDELLTQLENLIAKKQAIKTATMQQLLTGKTRLPQFASYTEGEKQGQLKSTKQSELGEIPEDWEVVCLGDIAEVRMCKRVLANQTKESGDIPFYKIGTFGGLPDSFISKDLYEDFKRKYSFPKIGDILISAAGTLGKTVVYDGKPSYFQDSNIVWLEINNVKICNEFLIHYYNVIKWASTEGSTISRLYNGIIKASLVTLPPIGEQNAIASILSDMDSEIQALEQRLAKTKDIKQGMMQELLTGRTRLPFEDASYAN